MDATFTKLQVWPTWRKMKRISVSAVHEDPATGTRVDEFCETLSRCLGASCELSKDLWPLTELRTNKLREIAAGEAAAADLVVISVHYAESLPQEVEDWIRLWLKVKGRRASVLTALFDPLYMGSSTSMQAHLQEVARKGRMELLARCDDHSEG